MSDLNELAREINGHKDPRALHGEVAAHLRAAAKMLHQVRDLILQDGGTIEDFYAWTDANINQPRSRVRDLMMRDVQTIVVTPGHVYFIEAVGLDLLKIGFSRGLSLRLHVIATACPAPVELLGAIPGTAADEHALHRRFADRVAHQEWFHLTAEFRLEVLSIIAAGGNE